MEQPKQEYREAYDAWQGDLTELHDVLPDGSRLEPPKLKGLLNREAREGAIRRGKAEAPWTVRLVLSKNTR